MVIQQNQTVFMKGSFNWVDRRYHWKIKKEWIIFTPGVIPGYTITIQKFYKARGRHYRTDTGLLSIYGWCC